MSSPNNENIEKIMSDVDDNDAESIKRALEGLVNLFDHTEDPDLQREITNNISELYMTIENVFVNDCSNDEVEVLAKEWKQVWSNLSLERFDIDVSVVDDLVEANQFYPFEILADTVSKTVEAMIEKAARLKKDLKAKGSLGQFETNLEDEFGDMPQYANEALDRVVTKYRGTHDFLSSVVVEDLSDGYKARREIFLQDQKRPHEENGNNDGSKRSRVDE